MLSAGSGLSDDNGMRSCMTFPDLEDFAHASRRAADRGDLAEATADAAEQAARDKQLLLEQSDQLVAEQTIALEMLTGALQAMWRQ